MSCVCSVHGKSRTLGNLEDDGAGGMKCAPAFQCQTGGGMGGPKRSAEQAWGFGAMDWFGGGPPKKAKGKGSGMICSVHFKERGLQNLGDDGKGGMCCQPGLECQMGAGGDNLRGVFCSTHKKKRNSDFLVDDGMGGMTCAPGNECQTGAGDGNTEKATCSLHGKTRSLESLVEDGKGGYKCGPGCKCQLSQQGGGGNFGGNKGGWSQPSENTALLELLGGGNFGGNKGGWSQPSEETAILQLLAGLGGGGKGKAGGGWGKGGGGFGKGKGGGKGCKWCQMGECWNH